MKILTAQDSLTNRFKLVGLRPQRRIRHDEREKMVVHVEIGVDLLEG